MQPAKDSRHDDGDSSESVGLAPDYAGRFVCAGPRCEDPCCNLDVVLGEHEYRRFQSFQTARLRSLSSQFVVLGPPTGNEKAYAHLARDPSGNCGFYTSERLCAVQSDFGEQALPKPCFLYPRVLSRVEGSLKGALHLSCPEAVRLVLFPQNLPVETGLEKFDSSDTVDLRDRMPGVQEKPYAIFNEVQAVMKRQLMNRSRPIWMRLMIVGALCARFDADGLRDNTELGAKLENEEEAWLPVLREVEADTAARLNLTFHVCSTLLNQAGPRFQEMFWTFLEGTGAQMGQGEALSLSKFVENERHHYRPFMDCHPAVLENFLLNCINQNLFPFGRTDSLHQPGSSYLEQWIALVLPFTCIETLLIGISGSSVDGLTEAKVVHTVQAFSRVIEHSHSWFEPPPLWHSRAPSTLRALAAMLRTNEGFV